VGIKKLNIIKIIEKLKNGTEVKIV
jgi:hypothetical protein